MKIICVLLVVVGHILNFYVSGGAVFIEDNPSFINMRNFIYSFHMPVFVAISGAIYYKQKEIGKYRNNIKFIKNKFKRLLVPYFVFSLFLLPVMCHIWNVRDSFSFYYDSFILAKDSRHLWFLLMLFYIFIFFNFLENYIRKWEIFNFILFFSFSYFLSNYVINIFCFVQFLKYLIWFYFGYLFEEYKVKVLFVIKKTWYIVLLYILITCSFGFNKVTINAPVCFCLLYYACSKLNIVGKKINLIRGVVDYSMGIYLFHPIIIYLLAYDLRDQNFSSLESFTILFVSGISISYIFTYIVKKVKMGFILGE